MTNSVATAMVISTNQACLIDTDVLIDYLRGHPSAQGLFENLPADCAVSAVSVAELHVGVREGHERKALDVFLSTFDLIDLTPAIATQGGLLRRDWGKTHGSGLNDALIAATALATERVLLTLNGKHFPMLPSSQLVVPYTKS